MKEPTRITNTTITLLDLVITSDKQNLQSKDT